MVLCLLHFPTRRDGRAIRSRIGRAHLHPLLERANLFRRKFFVFRRHLKIFVGVTDGFDEKTFFRLTRYERGPGVAALE